MSRKTIRIGTRGSELALWQTRHVKSRLEELHPSLEVEVIQIRTLGDKILEAPLAKIGDKGLFTKELDHALLDRRVDLAVHSCKDVPTAVPEGLTIAAILEREDVRDVFIAHRDRPVSFDALPQGAMVATGSLRRKCQLLHVRPDLQIVDIRGNLNTRLQKLDDSGWHGMLLARAGVLRLGWTERITDILPLDLMLPAVGQGALAIEAREDDAELREMLRPLIHDETVCSVTAERALLRRLEGGCQVPIGACGSVDGGLLHLRAVAGSLDGTRVVRGERSGPRTEADAIGTSLAGELLAAGGEAILREIRAGS